MPERKPTDLVQTGLRVRGSLYQRVMREAQKNKTSLNREICRRLELSFDAAALRSIEQVAADLVNAHRKFANR